MTYVPYGNPNVVVYASPTMEEDNDTLVTDYEWRCTKCHQESGDWKNSVEKSLADFQLHECPVGEEMPEQSDTMVVRFSPTFLLMDPTVILREKMSVYPVKFFDCTACGATVSQEYLGIHAEWHGKIDSP